MAIETEKKFRLEAKQYNKIAARLEKLGAEFAHETFEENYLHRGGVLDSRRAILRLRKTDEKTTLTYKEAISVNSHLKRKTEFETEVTDVEATEKIIGSLGYRLSVIYEKRRKTFHLDDVEVVLDELPFGLFMEIEGTGKAIARAERRLGIKRLKPEIRGYPRLTQKYGKMRRGVMEARFQRRRSAR